MFTASLTFQPFGSCSKARRSALFARFDDDLFSPTTPLVSLRFLGRPRSMMLLFDSDWFRLCPMLDALRTGSGSALGVADASDALSFGPLTAAWLAAFSHGLGEARASMGADTGVGRVEVVAADLGVMRAPDRGVKGVLDSSVRAERRLASTGVLPERRRVRESCLVSRCAGEPSVGMTRGARVLGERGCGNGFLWRLLARELLTFSSGFSSTLMFLDMKSTRCGGFHEWPGALIERSWRGGRPGMVAGDWALPSVYEPQDGAEQDMLVLTYESP